jgi:hypothetical protein
MVPLNCPLCGSPQRITAASAYSRLYCRKCHTPFHLDRAGSAVVGEPPDVGESAFQEMKQALRHAVERIPTGRIVAWLAGFLVVAAGVYFLVRPGERLEQAAERLARALSEGDQAYVQSVAAPGTGEEAARWYAEVRLRLAQERAHWYAQGEVITAHAEEDRARRTGTAGISIHPAASSGLDMSLANPTAATDAAPESFDVQTQWVRNIWGGWRLDGRATATATGSRPTP